MAQPARRRNPAVSAPEPSPKGPAVLPAPAPPAAVPDRAKAMVEALDRAAQVGGILTFDPPKKPYGFPSKLHINMDHDLWMARHRLRLSPTADRLLTFLVGTHDDKGRVKAKQTELAGELECSQGAVSKAMKQLDSKNLAWRVPKTREWIQLNPLAAYRWRSNKHHVLLAEMSEELKTRQIEIPKPGRRTA